MSEKAGKARMIGLALGLAAVVLVILFKIFR